MFGTRDELFVERLILVQSTLPWTVNDVVREGCGIYRGKSSFQHAHYEHEIWWSPPPLLLTSNISLKLHHHQSKAHLRKPLCLAHHSRLSSLLSLYSCVCLFPLRAAPLSPRAFCVSESTTLRLLIQTKSRMQMKITPEHPLWGVKTKHTNAMVLDFEHFAIYYYYFLFAAFAVIFIKCLNWWSSWNLTFQRRGQNL